MSDDDLHIYVHWPFCRSKCPYCDFNSHVDSEVEAGRWLRAFIRELECFAGALFADDAQGRTIGSIFFGGGTPSLMEPTHVAVLIETVGRLWPLAPDCEITLEANPTSSEAGRFQALRAAGVNRLSIGVQSFEDEILRFLGRSHSGAEARAAVDQALAVFDRVSFDLIYAVPGQSADRWRRQLDAALETGVRHLSLYQLTIAPDTAFHRQGVRAVDDDLGSVLYEATQERLEVAGLPAYEISNHAAPGEACRHNLAIWRGADYLPVGPGAEGRLRAAGRCLALRQHRQPQRWLDAVEALGHGLAEREILTDAERRSELVILGLRLSEGLDRERFRRRGGVDVDEVLDTDGVRQLVAAGLVDSGPSAIRATAAGRERLDWVLPRLIA